MIKHALPVALLAGGVVAMGLSLVWADLFPPGHAWTPEQSAELRRAEQAMVDWQLKLVAARRRGVVGGESTGHTKRLAERYRRIKQEFDAAKAAPQRNAERLRYAALVLLAAGVVAGLRLRPKAAEDAAPESESQPAD